MYNLHKSTLAGVELKEGRLESLLRSLEWAGLALCPQL